METSLENLYVDKDKWKRVCNWRWLVTGMTFDSRENSKWVSVKVAITRAVHIMIDSLKRALTGLTQARVKLNFRWCSFNFCLDYDWVACASHGSEANFCCSRLASRICSVGTAVACRLGGLQAPEGGGGVLPIIAYTGRLQVYERVGISPDEVYEKIRKSVILVNKKANRCILWLWKSQESIMVLWFIPILKTVYLLQLKGMQNSKLGNWKGYHLPIDLVNKRGIFSVKHGI